MATFSAVVASSMGAVAAFTSRSAAPRFAARVGLKFLFTWIFYIFRMDYKLLKIRRHTLKYLYPMVIRTK
jgi:hypothetical protein